MFETLLQRGERLARVEANRAVLRFVNGIEWMLRDPKTVVGRTPFDIVHRSGKLQVRRYHLPSGTTARRHPLPVLLVPPLMVKPFIFDLFPGRSLAAFLLARGFAVYLVDFGEPDEADEYVTLDHYVLDWLPAACAAAKRDAHADELSLLGYCMGALFALCHVAANDDASVRNIVSIGAPIDQNKMGMLAAVARFAAPQTEFLTRQIGNIPGGLSSTAFRLLTPMKNVTRYADLFLNMWDREYVLGFDAMNQWVRQFIDYPQAAFLQFSREFVRHNRLVKGELQFGSKVADLRTVHAALLAFAGRTDQIAPPAAARAVMEAVGSTDKAFRLVSGGHMGVFAGATAVEQVWRPAAAWLASRSQARRPAARRPRRARLGVRRARSAAPALAHAT